MVHITLHLLSEEVRIRLSVGAGGCLVVGGGSAAASEGPFADAAAVAVDARTAAAVAVCAGTDAAVAIAVVALHFIEGRVEFSENYNFFRTCVHIFKLPY